MNPVRDNRGGNWFWAHNDIISRYGPQMGAYGVAVYVVLCRYAGREQQTWIGQRTIAAELNISRATVQRAIVQLRTLGLVAVEEETNERGQTSNTYTLLPLPDSVEGGLPQSTPASVRGGDLASRDAPPASVGGTHTINKTQLKRPIDQIDRLLEENRRTWRSREQS